MPLPQPRVSLAITLTLSFALSSSIATTIGGAAAARDDGGLASITADEIEAHVRFLASDELRGRAAGTEGGRAAAKYVAEAFASFGLKAIDDDEGGAGDYFQPFETPSRGETRGKPTENVVGFLEGSDPEKRGEFLLIGAHYDHIGWNPETGEIFNGADDNASGTSVMLELAEAFAKREKAPARSLLFIAFGAEELGLVGSRHYVAHPLRPLEKTRWMVNLEMMGRGEEGKATVMMLSELADEALDVVGAASLEAELDLVDGGRAHIDAGDQFPFHEAGVPILCFYGGDDHPDYHQATDTADKIQPEWMRSMARLVYLSVDGCAE